LTHYSGSFKEMNNQTSIELNAKNKQGLTLNDSYDTVRGFKNEYTGKNLDEIVYRDKYKKVGSLNEEYFKKWKDLVAGIQEFKQLFEIKRTGDNSVKDSNGITILKRNSLLQEQDGSFASYPVTDGTTTYSALQNNSNSVPSTPLIEIASDDTSAKTGASARTANADRWLNQSGKTFVNGGGKSLSTKDGNWFVDDRKDKLKELIEASLPELTAIEQELGIGGSEITQITKHKIETIGMLMNDFGSIRFDNAGKLLSNEVLVDRDVVYVNKIESPLVEYVHVQDLPGGTSTLNVCNRYNVMVGAGGLNLKSYGPTNITGTVTNVTGEQVNVASENEINIDAKTINISAEILRLRNKRQRQIYIDDNLGVNKNVIIGGGLHVEGETYLQHVTAPREYQRTEATQVGLRDSASWTASINGTGTVDNTSQTVSFSNVTISVINGGSDIVDSHEHWFANLPLTLKDGNVDVRQLQLI